MEHNMTPDDALSPLDARDHDILTAISEAAARHDPPPQGLVDRVVFALSLELMRAELATLESQDPVAARGVDPVTTDTVTFTASNLSLMLVTTDVDGGVRIDGWVTGGGVTVEAHCGDARFEETSDVTGRILWPLLPHGPVRFLIRPVRHDQRPVITPTIEV